MLQLAFCDDDLSELQTIQTLLDRYRVARNQEIRYTAFQNAWDLLAEVERGTRYDVLLLDVLMPGQNGIEVAGELRQYDNNVKIIFLTSSRSLRCSPTPWGPISTSSSPSGRRAFTAS